MKTSTKATGNTLMDVKQRIVALRREMAKRGLAAYLVPSADAHMDEYVPCHWRRRAWMSGFTGSAGELVVTRTKAGLWTDSRYFLQAEAQLKGSGIVLMRMGEPTTPNIVTWLARTMPRGSKVGVDPRVIPVAQHKLLAGDLANYDLQLVMVEENLVDKLWTDKPEAEGGPMEVHPVKYAGESLSKKLARVRKAMKESGATAHVIAALDSIAWLFNIRGTDVENNPFVISYAIVMDKKATLFTDRRKVDASVRRAFGRHVVVKPYKDLREAVKSLAKPTEKVWLDPGTTNQWIAELLTPKARLLLKESPIVLYKAMKNDTELAGAKAAHVRDGAAMVRFLTWLDRAVRRQSVTEISLAEKLEEFRELDPLYRGPSFDTIAGYAGHGAIIHYSATPQTNARVRPTGILLIDSGGQYLDGTTDITRTISLSKPTPEQKDRYTRVLKGHLALLLTPFPVGTSGKQIDTLARKALWDSGLNYGHGTGHGVGSYLGVHEGPQSISPTRDTGVPLRPGMVCSNEPGYYAPGKYGMRIENLVFVAEIKRRSNGQVPFLKFENLTLCPIDTRLIEKSLLTSDELAYLNSYHAQVRKSLLPHLNHAEAAWLEKATRPI
jgi:Xaa-Pro aminopeptidase